MQPFMKPPWAIALENHFSLWKIPIRPSLIAETLPLFVQCLFFPNSMTELWIFTWAYGHYHFPSVLCCGHVTKFWPMGSGNGQYPFKGRLGAVSSLPSRWLEWECNGWSLGRHLGRPWGGIPMFELRMVEKQREARVRTVSCWTSSGLTICTEERGNIYFVKPLTVWLFCQLQPF